MRSTNREFLRFLVAGGANTLFSYVLYAGFQGVMPYQAAFTLCYVITIATSYYLNATFVFKSELRWSKALQFPMVYLAQYLLGLALMYLLVELLGMHPLVAPIVVVVVSVPVTFVLSRIVLKGEPRGGGKSCDDLVERSSSPRDPCVPRRTSGSRSGPGPGSAG